MLLEFGENFSHCSMVNSPKFGGLLDCGAIVWRLPIGSLASAAHKVWQIFLRDIFAYGSRVAELDQLPVLIGNPSFGYMPEGFQDPGEPVDEKVGQSFGKVILQRADNEQQEFHICVGQTATSAVNYNGETCFESVLGRSFSAIC